MIILYYFKKQESDKMMETKYIVKAYTPRTDVPWKDTEVLVDLVEVLDDDAMVRACKREAVEGVAVRTVNPRRDFFVDLNSFMDFIVWKFMLDGE